MEKNWAPTMNLRNRVERGYGITRLVLQQQWVAEVLNGYGLGPEYEVEWRDVPTHEAT